MAEQINGFSAGGFFHYEKRSYFNRLELDFSGFTLYFKQKQNPGSQPPF